MTEREKADAGLLYNAGDPALAADRDRVKDLCLRFNALDSRQQEERERLIGRILGQAGEGCLLTAPFWCDYGYNIRVGKYFYTNHNCVILDCAPVTFGDEVLIGPNCCFPRRATRWTPPSAARGWRLPTPSPWGAGAGLEPM